MAIVVSATYTGSAGAQTVAIPGSPGTPAFIWIKAATGARVPVCWTTTMGADKTKKLSGATALTTGLVTAVGSSSFDVGTDPITNSDGVTYYYVAIVDNAVGDCKAGSYTGNGSSQSINTTIPVDVFLTMGDSTLSPAWKSSDMPGDDYNSQFAVSISTIDGITLSGANASLGSGANHNTNAIPFHYFAMAKSSVFSNGTFVGDGTSSHDVTPFTFTPDAVWSQGSAQSSAAAIRFQDNAGDSSSLMGGNNFGADRIQAFITNGIQVGGSDGVNVNLDTYYAVGFKEGTSTGPTTPLPGGGASGSLLLLGVG